MFQNESLSRPLGCYLVCGILTGISSHQDQCPASAPGCVVLPLLSQTASLPAPGASQRSRLVKLMTKLLRAEAPALGEPSLSVARYLLWE